MFETLCQKTSLPLDILRMVFSLDDHTILLQQACANDDLDLLNEMKHFKMLHCVPLSTILEQFFIVCQNSAINIIYWFMYKVGSADFCEKSAFSWKCHTPQLPILQWLHSIHVLLHNKVDLHDTYVCETCDDDHFEHIVSPITSHLTLANLRSKAHAKFRLACEQGTLNLAKWTSTLLTKEEIQYNNQAAFRVACHNGHLQVAQWLGGFLTIDDMRSEQNYAICWACWNGHLHVAQWLKTKLTREDFCANDNLPFRAACRNGHLKVAQWLSTLLSKTDMSSNDNEAFHLAQKMGNTDIVSWLRDLLSLSHDLKQKHVYDIMCEIMFESQ